MSYQHSILACVGLLLALSIMVLMSETACSAEVSLSRSDVDRALQLVFEVSGVDRDPGAGADVSVEAQNPATFPLRNFTVHAVSIHHRAGNVSAQAVVHHYCGHVNPKVMQCLLFDSHLFGARVIGVEYIISRDLFKKLPIQYRKLWHSHVYEVLSGILVFPGVTNATKEKLLLADILNSYGITYHILDPMESSPFPQNVTELWFSILGDALVRQDLVQQVDKLPGVNGTVLERRKQRKQMGLYELAKSVVEGADAWARGPQPALQMCTCPLSVNTTAQRLIQDQPPAH